MTIGNPDPVRGTDATLVALVVPVQAVKPRPDYLALFFSVLFALPVPLHSFVCYSLLCFDILCLLHFCCSIFELASFLLLHL